MKRLSILLFALFLLISCRKWENRDCRRAYICGTWKIDHVLVDGSIYDIPKEFENVKYSFTNSEYYGHEGYDDPDFYYVYFDTTKVLVENYKVNDSLTIDSVFTYIGYWYVWGTDGTSLHLNNQTYISNYLPSFLSRDILSEEWIVSLISENNLLLTNNQLGKEVLVMLYKIRDSKRCHCSNKID